MTTPWLHIPLADYEGHMALEAVGQADFLAALFARQLSELRPASLAVVGCAGGNGFDRIDAASTPRVVGIDINRHYIDEVRRRFDQTFDVLELHVWDIASVPLQSDPVDFIYAGLILEYVDVRRALSNLALLCRSGGHLVTVLQMPSATHGAVTPSPFESLRALAAAMKPVDPAELAVQAADLGFERVFSGRTPLPSGKEFAVDRFQMNVRPRHRGHT